MDHVAGDDGYERFAVRSFDGREGRWVQYEIDTVERRFVRTAGSVADGRVELVSDDERLRVTWSRGEEGSVVRRDERSDDGETWSAVREVELGPTFYGGE